MTNYENEYNKAMKKIGELGEKIANKDQMLRQFAEESIEDRKTIRELEEYAEHRECGWWKLATFIACIYIIYLLSK